MKQPNAHLTLVPDDVLIGIEFLLSMAQSFASLGGNPTHNDTDAARIVDEWLTKVKSHRDESHYAHHE